MLCGSKPAVLTFEHGDTETVNLTVLRASGLAADRYFVKLHASFSKQTFHTKHMPRPTANPQWNETFQFHLHRLAGAIYVDVYVYNRVFPDRLFGSGLLKLEQSMADDVHAASVPLLDRGGVVKLGELQLRIDAKSQPTLLPQRSRSVLSPNASLPASAPVAGESNHSLPPAPVTVAAVTPPKPSAVAGSTAVMPMLQTRSTEAYRGVSPRSAASPTTVRHRNNSTEVHVLREQPSVVSAGRAGDGNPASREKGPSNALSSSSGSMLSSSSSITSSPSGAMLSSSSSGGGGIKTVLPPLPPMAPMPVRRPTDRLEDFWTKEKEIGHGGMSVVYLGTSKTDGRKAAIKIISKRLLKEASELHLLQREIDIMRKLHHPNLIELYDVFESPDTLSLVMELASGGELFESIIERGGFYPEGEAARLIAQVLDAIKYCHERGVAHRDLKPENLLLVEKSSAHDQTEALKIADFGLAKDFDQQSMETQCGTPDYVAPEVILDESYNEAVDLWSIGVITYVILCGSPPFYSEYDPPRQKDLFDKITKAHYVFFEPEWNAISSEAKDFISKILVVDPTKRFTAEQALMHPWILKHRGPPSVAHGSRSHSFDIDKFKTYASKYNRKYDRESFTDVRPFSVSPHGTHGLPWSQLDSSSAKGGRRKR